MDYICDDGARQRWFIYQLEHMITIWEQCGLGHVSFNVTMTHGWDKFHSFWLWYLHLIIFAPILYHNMYHNMDHNLSHNGHERVLWQHCGYLMTSVSFRWKFNCLNFMENGMISYKTYWPFKCHIKNQFLCYQGGGLPSNDNSLITACHCR